MTTRFAWRRCSTSLLAAAVCVAGMACTKPRPPDPERPVDPKAAAAPAAAPDQKSQKQ